MISEGIEEGVQAVLEPIFKSIVTGENIENIDWAEVTYSALLGALSAGTFESGPSTVNAVQKVKATKRSGQKILGEGNLDALKLKAGEYTADQAVEKNLGKVNKKASAKNVGRLASAVARAEDARTTTAATSELVSEGLSEEEARKVTEFAEKISRGYEPTAEETAEIEVITDKLSGAEDENNTAESGVKYSLAKDVDGNTFVDITEDIFDENNGESVARTIQRVISERFDNLIDIHGQKIQVNKITNDEFRKSNSANGLLKQSSQAYNDKLKTIANADEILSAAKNWIGEQKKHTRTDDIVEFARGNVEYRVGKNSYVADVIVGTRKNGSAVLYDLINIYDKKITEAPVTMVRNNISQRRQETSVGSSVSQNDKKVKKESSQNSSLESAASKYGAQAGAMISTYNVGPAGQDVAKFDAAYRAAYDMGAEGVKLGYMMKSPLTSYLTETQRELAYSAGADSQTIGKAKRGEGKVIYEGAAALVKTSELQNTSLRAVNFLSKALGVNVHIFDSNEPGYEGRNGFYDPTDGSVWLDIRAGNEGKGTMLYTMAHELTHFIQQWSQAKYEAFADFLLENYAEKGVDIDDLVAAQIEKAARHGVKLTYDEAFDEVIADSCEAMLADGDAVTKIAELKERDKGLWDKIVEYITQLVNKIKSLYKDLDPDSAEGRFVAEQLDTFEELKRLWTEALVEASENYAGRTAQKNTVENGVKYSRRYESVKPNEEILEMVDKVYAGTYRDNEKIYLGEVPTNIAKRIYELTKIDVTGFKAIIEARQVSHIIKDHGVSGDTDQSMKDPNDIAKIEYALKEPDDISESGKTQAYSYMENGRNKTANTVLYEKRIGDKSYYVVQAVPDTKAKAVYIVTAFIGKSGYKKEASQLINANRLDVTSKNGSVNTSTPIIRDTDESVKRKNSLKDDISARELLVNALEATTQNDAEREKLEQYRTKIWEMNAEQAKLRDFRAEIKKLSFAKGPRDTERINELKAEAQKSENRINIYDRQLLRLESTKALSELVEREKDRVYKRAREKGREVLREYREKGSKRELRNKIKQFKRELENTLQHPTENKYIPAALGDAMIEVCNLINTDMAQYKKDGSINKAQARRDETKEKLEALRDEYKALKDSDKTYMREKTPGDSICHPGVF